MREMSLAETHTFLLQGTRTGMLATTRADGRPHVVPIWFLLDGNDLIFTMHEQSVKARNILRDPRVALCVDEAVPPYAFVLVEGTISTSTDLAEMLIWATRIGGRYMGADRAEEFGRRNTVEGEFLARLTPTRIIAQADIAGY